MSQATATITGKGQVQIPASIRKALDADIGDNVIFMALDNGSVLLKVIKKKKLADLGGSMKSTVKSGNFEEEAAMTKSLWTRKRVEENK